jgi:nitroimidazol reductase NimA-like FMN-containing flavoprotein (pyridoxamine 5'-phosphate oxidase superfamily)
MTDPDEMISVLKRAEHVTIAMSMDDEPYLVTLNHAYDDSRRCIYFHCAKEGRKVEILRGNNRVWGQGLIDGGYKQGSCDHLFKTTQFSGRVIFVEDLVEKEEALRLMIKKLEKNPEKVIAEQITPESLERVKIGRIDISFMTGKKSMKA